MTRIAYKLVRKKKDGKIYSLFINKHIPVPIGEWITAKCIPTKGFAIREGWHCLFKPEAKHLKMKLKSGEKREWVEVEVDDWITYERPESQGGKWILAKRMKINYV
jgi:hypothetical protein